ncbi:Uma2 family endonuclease [Sphingomonas sp. CJ99]
MTEHRPLNTEHQRVKLRVEDYLLLDRSGAFDGYAKTELLDGELFCMNARHRPHARVKSRLFLEISAALKAMGSQVTALVEASIALSETSAPEPDIVLTSEADGDGLVPLASVALVVEVADTTLSTDLTQKAALYAVAGIPEYWVADLAGRTLRQMWGPDGNGYRERRKVAFGDAMVSVTIDGLKVETSGL